MTKSEFATVIAYLEAGCGQKCGPQLRKSEAGNWKDGLTSIWALLTSERISDSRTGVSDVPTQWLVLVPTGNIFQVAPTDIGAGDDDQKKQVIAQLSEHVGEDVREEDVRMHKVLELYPSAVMQVLNRKEDSSRFASRVAQIPTASAVEQILNEGKICPLCGRVIGRGERHGVGLCP